MMNTREYVVTIGNWSTTIEASQHTQAKQKAAKKYWEEVDNTYPLEYLITKASARVKETKPKSILDTILQEDELTNQYAIFIGDWVGRIKAESSMEATLKGIDQYKRETGSQLSRAELLSYIYVKELKHRDIAAIQKLEREQRSKADLNGKQTHP